MSSAEPLVRNISDTALLAAIYRARETDRPNALFRDPFARRLAGERGDQIAKSMPFSEKGTWAWIARTVSYDSLVMQEVHDGADLVVNLAAGLDTRPYRMSLPPSLRWIEVDLPDILAYKEEILRDEKPVCALERIRLDLSDVNARRELFARLGGSARKVVVITEGLLVYFSPDEVASLARDLAAQPSFQSWILDVASPGLLQMLRKQMGAQIREGNAEFKFGPKEGPGFFVPFGWTPVEVRSMLKTAARLKRLPPIMRLFSWLPESNAEQGSRPWSAVCLFRNTSPAAASV
ncbi:MAG TPA: SAM-dependent methyltransferase [Candidatus Limnocylindrales bacterium]|nr:SAM-dependent methyltransferase [Candidatus Limnocylindrales bacterium]